MNWYGAAVVCLVGCFFLACVGTLYGCVGFRAQPGFDRQEVLRSLDRAEIGVVVALGIADLAGADRTSTGKIRTAATAVFDLAKSTVQLDLLSIGSRADLLAAIGGIRDVLNKALVVCGEVGVGESDIALMRDKCESAISALESVVETLPEPEGEPDAEQTEVSMAGDNVGLDGGWAGV